MLNSQGYRLCWRQGHLGIKGKLSRLVEVKHCVDTRPKNQLDAFKQQHHDLCCNLLMASAQVTLYAVLLGVDGVI
eukprot:26336-Pelagomonas_calceolata.AAC.1